MKKVGEEAAEVVIAGKNRDKDEISYETADLIYHLTVMLVDNGMTWKIFIRKWKEEVTNRKSVAEILATDFFVLRGATFWYCKMSVFVI